MATDAAKPTIHERRVVDALKAAYLPKHPQATIDTTIVVDWAIWVRIIDAGVTEIPIFDRAGDAWDALKSLPNETYARLTMVFVLAPSELTSSEVNHDFEACRATRRSRKTSRGSRSERAAAQGAE